MIRRRSRCSNASWPRVLAEQDGAHDAGNFPAVGRGAPMGGAPLGAAPHPLASAEPALLNTSATVLLVVGWARISAAARRPTAT